MERLEWFALLLALSAALVLLIYFHNRFWLPRDDGYYAHIADRILHGERLHRDVQALHPGLVYYVNAVALRLFGHDLISLRYPLIAAGICQVVLVFLILKQRGIAIAAFAGLAVTAFSIVQFFSPTAHWYCPPIFFLIVLLLDPDCRDRRGRLELVGFLIASLFLFRQLTGVFVAMGTVTCLLLERRPPSAASGALARALILTMAGGLALYLFSKTDSVGWIAFGIWPLLLMARSLFLVEADNRRVLRLVLRLSFGAALAAFPLLLYHLLAGTLSDWFSDVVLDAIALGEFEYQKAARYGPFLLASLRHLTSADMAGRLNGAYWLAVLLAAALLAALTLMRMRPGRGEQAIVAPLPFLACFYGLVALHYQDPAYLYYAAGPIVAGLLWYAAGLRRPFQIIPAGAVALFTAVALHYHAGQPISRSYAGVMAGERHELVRSSAPALSGLYLTPSDRQTYEALLDMIDRHSAPGDPILGVPAQSELFFLASRRNPLRFSFLPFGIRDAGEVSRTLDILKATPPRIVFHVPALPYNTAHTDALMAWVRQNYRALPRVREFDIYVLP